MNAVNFDFAAILSLLTLVTGIIWAADKWWLGPRRRASLIAANSLTDGVIDKPGPIVDFGRSFFPVILLVLLLRSFLAEPFRIPSGSMIPTLLIGDFILVNKFAYGLRDPVFHHKFISFGEPQRGDIVVFRYPVNPSQDFIKRTIGVPGDHISYRNKQLFVNDQPMPLDADGVYTSGEYEFQESLGSVRHRVIVNPSRPAEDFEFTVPEGQYFMMGDNRDGSLDSRSWGTVPEANLVGRAFFVWMSWDATRFRPDWSRIGHTIH